MHVSQMQEIHYQNRQSAFILPVFEAACRRLQKRHARGDRGVSGRSWRCVLELAAGECP